MINDFFKLYSKYTFINDRFRYIFVYKFHLDVIFKKTTGAIEFQVKALPIAFYLSSTFF